MAAVILYFDYMPFGMQLPGRNGGDDYRYGFQGQETDNEIKGEGNSINYKYRMHDPRIGRFFAVDPLAGRYPYYSPYAFSGNRVIDMVEVEGLEPAPPKVGASTLVIVIQGVGVDPPAGQTQAQNDPNSQIDMTGIGALTTLSSDDIQVVVFSSSRGYNTMADVGVTIAAFQQKNPDGNVIVVGHSQGADNAVELLDFCKNSLTVDLLITLDIKDAGTNNILTLDSDNIYGNVANAINYYQTADFIGGEDIEVQDATKTNGANILSPGSNHRSIDNDLYPYIVQDIMNFLNGEDVVKKAQERTLPTFNPADTGSPGMPGNSLKSESEGQKKGKAKK